MHSHIPNQLGLGSIVYAPSAEKTAASQRAVETRRALLRAAAEAEERGGEGGWTVGGRSGSSSGGRSGSRRQRQQGDGPDDEAEPLSMWA